jgi:uncharacterized protein (DUF2147 family)
MKIIHFTRVTMSMALASLYAAGTAWAAAEPVPGPVGIWRIADGSAVVDIRSCGDNLCGYVASTAAPDAPVGQQVFFDMRPEGDQWSGIIVDVSDGQRYTGKISLVSDRTLKVEGCVMGGMFCGGQQWSRVK